MNRISLLVTAMLLQSSFSIPLAQANGGQQAKPLPVTQPAGKTQKLPASDEDVVRITTNLIQIDASVTDKSGKQITDLRPDDFVVLQDGRQQKVTHLSYIAIHPPASAPAVKSSTSL